MKNWKFLFSEQANVMTKLMSEACNSLVIEKFNLVRCPRCADFRREMRGQYEAVGCACPDSPICGYFTQNETQKAKFENFACPCGRPIEEAQLCEK